MAAASLAIGLAGCGESESDSSREARAIARLSAIVRVSADYIPYASPTLLAGRSDLVVRGTIVSVEDGPTLQLDDLKDIPDFVRSAVVGLRIEGVVSGTLPADNDGNIYIYFFGTNLLESGDYDKFFPSVPAAIVYLKKVGPLEQIVPGASVKNPAAGRPKGQPLFAVTNPQGFLIETPTGVAQLMEGVEFPGATLDDVAPGATAFPTDGIRLPGL